MKIVLLRHGLTPGNLRKAYLGRTDESLCEQGISDLLASPVREEVLSFLPDVGEVYVSSRKRTQETASLLFPEKEQVLMSSLDEMDFGVFEGKNYEDLSESSVYCDWVAGGCVSACPKGEGLDEFLPRVREGFLSAVEESGSVHSSGYSSGIAKVSRGKLFVIHGGTMMGICSQFVEGSTYYQWQVPCGTALFFHWEGGRLWQR